MKNKKLKFWLLTCTFTFLLLPFNFYAYAQEDNKLAALSKQALEAKTAIEASGPLAELKDIYFKDNNYNGFADFLKSLEAKNSVASPSVGYYLALARYHQLKYLEAQQSWDEYFSQGNAYRDDITAGAQKAIAATTAADPVNLYARLILWQFHRDQQDEEADQAFADLTNSVLEYAKVAPDPAPVKVIADKLLSYTERGKARELYKIYVEKVVNAGIKDEELGNLALAAYKEANLDLAETFYDLYVERILKSANKERILPLLIEVAKLFSYKDEGLNDPLYAEKIFKKIEEAGGKKAFDQELIYLRGFNLEKAKEYAQAKEVYLDLLARYPKTAHAQKVTYKVGIIFTYILRDIKEGRNYFTGLAEKETASPQVISSLYQLGLLAQWEENPAGAKEYYQKLLEKAGNNFPEEAGATAERLKEIEESQPLEYNLKTFLDACLKEENALLQMQKVDLNAHPYQAKKDQTVDISAGSAIIESGCAPVATQYLWSGDLGTLKPAPSGPTFSTTYGSLGTKVINLTLISPTGILGRNLDFVDVD